MSGISKINSVFKPSGPPSQKSNNASEKGAWQGQVKGQPQATSSQRTLKGVSFERAPQGTTNQNGELSPEQMARFLGQELSKRMGRQKIGRKRKRYSNDIDDDLDSLSEVLSENEGLLSLLNGASPEAIAEFLKYFQDEIGRHLAGVSFGNVTYTPELLALLEAHA